MDEPRRRPGVGFWVTVGLVALFAYPLSIGPACWISSRTGFGVGTVTIVYRPIIRAAGVCPKPASEIVEKYSTIFAKDYWYWWEETWRPVGVIGAR
jgi:hypothetical protein